MYNAGLHICIVCVLFGAIKHLLHWFAIAFLAPSNIVNIPLGVFKHVAGKDLTVEILVRIILAVLSERGEKRLRKHDHKRQRRLWKGWKRGM